MRRFDNFDEVIALTSEIQEETPDRCKPCSRAELVAHNLARGVIEGEITLDEAKFGQITEFEECRFGAAENFDGSPDCRYGIACEFIPRPAYGSEEARNSHKDVLPGLKNLF